MTLANIEAEQAILGALLVNNDVLARVATIINAGDFCDPVHQRIFDAIQGRIGRDMLATPVTLRNDFADDQGLRELGGPGYLTRLAGAAISIFAAGDYAKIVASLAAKRRLAAALQEAMGALNDPATDASTVLAQVEAYGLTDDARAGGNIVPFQAALVEAMRAATAAHHGTGVPGVPTGVQKLDEMLGGMFPGDLIVLGGRPGMGKSSLALSIATHAADCGHGVAIASLEMTPDSIALRAISEATAMQGKGVAYTAARKGDLSEYEMEIFARASVDIQRLPISIIPPKCRDLGALYASAKRCAKQFEAKGTPLGLVIVDYLQLVRAGRKNRFEEVTEVSIALKEMAINLGVPVLALSQLSRGVEQRDDKRPMMSDLRESGQLEQDADAILFAFREEFYLRQENQEDMTSEEISEHHTALMRCRGIMEIIVAKNRMGETGTARVQFSEATNSIQGGAA